MQATMSIGVRVIHAAVLAAAFFAIGGCTSSNTGVGGTGGRSAVLAGATGTAGGGGTTSGIGGTTGGTGGTVTGTGGGAGGGSTVASGSGACGAAGKACCAGSTCTGGGCCVAGQCVANGSSCNPLTGTCSNGACGTCGGPGAPCCSTTGGTSICTAPGTRCQGGGCALCGGSAGEPCCTSTDAPSGLTSYVCSASGLVCAGSSFTSLCAVCGKPGTVCCSGSTCEGGGCCFDGRCLAENEACRSTVSGSGGSSGGTCVAGRCSGCGGASQPCCGTSSPSCAAGLLCRTGTCSTCGGLGEVCCSGTDGTDRCTSGAVCSATSSIGDSLCAKCGGPGESCCAGNTCDSGCCFGGRCVAEGSDCIYGSNTYGQCKSGRCGCGSFNEACCPSTISTSQCATSDLVCSGSYSLTPGRCVVCGTANSPCCARSTCTGAGLQCSYDDLSGIYTCQSCGDLGQICCMSGPDTKACNTTGAICETSSHGGLCAICGSAGSRCCGGSVCTDGTSICADSRCVKPPSSNKVTFSSGGALGAMTGPGWVSLGDLDTVTDPTCGGTPITSKAPCPSGTRWNSPNALCVSGGIPALPPLPTQSDYDNNPGIEFGVDATPNPGESIGMPYSAIAISVSGLPLTGLRIGLHRAGDPAFTSYCAANTGAAIKLTNFNTACWDNTGTAFASADAGKIDKVSVQVFSTQSWISVDNLCLNSITFTN